MELIPFIVMTAAAISPPQQARGVLYVIEEVPFSRMHSKSVNVKTFRQRYESDLSVA